MIKIKRAIRAMLRELDRQARITVSMPFGLLLIILVCLLTGALWYAKRHQVVVPDSYAVVVVRKDDIPEVAFQLPSGEYRLRVTGNGSLGLK